MGADLFYVHGMGGSPEDWNEVVREVPGQALQLDTNAPNPAVCASLLADQIAELSGAHPFTVCGYSMGGRIALLAANALIQRGLPLQNLILVSTGFGESDLAIRKKRVSMDEEWALLAERDPLKFWEKWYQQPIFASFHSLPPATQEAWLSSRKSIDISSLLSQLRCLSPGHHEHLLEMLESLAGKGISVLYIVGELDKKYVELSQMVQKIGGVRVKVLPNAGHILPLEVPAKLAESIRSCLA
jgi:2-succinyl-6-hydroxy-2,4-cyclohexadiene-1-carboxylate synthase